MKRSISLLFFAFMALFLGSCYPDNGGLEIPGEENLVVTLNPDPGMALVRIPGSTYDFQVNISSKMPPQGVQVAVVYTKDAPPNPVIFSQTYTITNSSLNVTITDVPFNEIGTVTVTVTSKTKPSNTVTKSFKLSKK